MAKKKSTYDYMKGIFGVTVFANDLWINPTDNYKRFVETGVDDKVFPIHAEAHNFPYANGFFDAARRVTIL